ncbi:AT-rich interactive domain-containing protein 2-like isoform X2 [Argiope bruennichi]|uniref:AT-rich interactive domain-containing protein 2-like isoform X2 n=1 Tax=Argiope bruennichi TaxID=94029 RepID=UPI002494FDCF|nr:AT-rich interactive domain-containing protein 2-like isoform X2 [Argiope bruennichi]
MESSYIDQNEKIQCLGEDRDQNKKLSFEFNDQKSQLPHKVPVVDHAVQRDVPASACVITAPKNIPSSVSYDKLCLSLLSGLPNEQEFALNVCTILSNEGSYSIHLEKAPKLVDLLVAQAGVWNEGPSSLKSLYLENWKDIEGRNMQRFWQSTLDLQNSPFLKTLGFDFGECDSNEVLLNLEDDLGSVNLEGQRVLRVALILHNLSFEKNNVPVLVRSSIFMKFLLLCIHSSWANLRQTAYDTLANLASEIDLHIEKDSCSRVLFETVIKGLQSRDRFMSIRSMDILSQLCGRDLNEDIIPSRLDMEIYQQMVSYLTVHDIMLLFYTLEALYALSDLGRYACDKIACVHGSIGILVSLLTLEPSQYGSSAEIKMKIVEILVPADPDCEKEQSVSISSETTTTTATSTTSVVTTTSSSNDNSEAFAINWLKSNYEACPSGSMISRNDIYAEYVGYCTKAGRKGVINANIFGNCVKSSFPQTELKKVQSKTGIITFHHDGLRKKKAALPQPVLPSIRISNNTAPSSSVSTISISSPKPIQSPILKAHLSTSTTKSEVLSPSIKSPVPPKAQTPVPLRPAIPASQGNSTLIKSLLASKVQQKTLQRQVIPQNVSKMVIISPGTSLNPGSSPGLVRCVVPQMNIRPNLQARIVGNKGCLITSNPTQILQSSPILSTVMPHKVFQQQAVIATSSPTSHLNGIQGSEQMEVCTPAVETKASEVIQTQVIQTHPVQNHVANDSASRDNPSNDLNNLQCSEDKVLNNVSEPNFILSQIQGNTVTYRLAGPNEVPIVGNRLFVQSKPSGDGLSLSNEPNGTNVFPNTKTTSNCMSLPLIQPKIESAPSGVAKPSLGIIEEQPADQAPVPQVRKVEICKKSPLLNGLLDKGKPSIKGDILFNALVENGIEASDVGLELPKSPSPVHIPVQPKLIPVSPALNSIVLPASSLNSVLIPTSSLTSGILPLSSSSNTVITSYILTSPTSVATPAVSLNSNGANVVQIRTGKTTFSGTAEVQPDQKGVVRLHIESPENSNQGSDLSSISDIARTLECASEAISKTNAECNTQVPQTCAVTTVTTMIGSNPTTVISSNTPATLARANQQIIVVTPTLNQPQLQLQSPNIKFCILHTMPMAEDGVDSVAVPQINLNQLNQIQQQPILETTSVSSLNLKRPSSDPSPMCVVSNTKKPRVEQQTLQSSPGVITVASPSADIKPSEPCTKAVSIDNLKLAPKINTVKPVQVQSTTDLPSEKEVKTLSGLLSTGGSTLVTATPSTSSKKGSSKLEFVCEWKDCNLKFSNPGSVFLHASKVHTPPCEGDMVCLWEGCDTMKRKRFSLLTHLQDWHCNERVLHTQAMRRRQIEQQGKTTLAPPQKPPPHPGYAPDAAVLAIKRHALQYVNPKELSEEKESALTKSIRLTSALILRNLVTHSALARTYTRRFEAELAYLAMSPVESAKAIAQCLAHLSRSSD